MMKTMACLAAIILALTVLMLVTIIIQCVNLSLPPRPPGPVTTVDAIQERHRRAVDVCRHLVATENPKQPAAGREESIQAARKASYIITGDPAASQVIGDPADALLLLVADAAEESDCRPEKISPDGHDWGWGQIHDTNFELFGITNPLNVWQNTRAQAIYFRDNLAALWRKWGTKKTRRDIILLAIGGYNASTRRVLGGQLPAYGRTRAYAHRVLALYEQMKGEIR